MLMGLGHVTCPLPNALQWHTGLDGLSRCLEDFVRVSVKEDAPHRGTGRPAGLGSFVGSGVRDRQSQRKVENEGLKNISQQAATWALLFYSTLPIELDMLFI